MEFGTETNRWPSESAAEDPAYTSFYFKSSEDERQTEQNNRKRKLDKDGFVKPFTPEIPVSSYQYEPASNNFDDHAAIYTVPTRFLDDDPPAANFAPRDGPLGDTCNGSDENVYRANKSDSKPVDRDNCQSESSIPVSIEQEIIDLGNECQSILSKRWLPVFNDTEGFELLCPARLDSLIAEAQQLEETLSQQKEIICNRLQGLGKTLQM